MNYGRSARKAVLPCLLAVAAWSSAAQAQSVSCSGIADWNATTIYNPGDKLVYQGHLYEALVQIWNAPPTYCTSCGWYQDLGTCSVGPELIVDGRHHVRMTPAKVEDILRQYP